MIEKNIIYKTKELERYYSRNRIKWKEFYPSEKKIINLLNMKNKKILDLGCACGGLGVVLKKKFKKINYTGVEINKRSAIKAKLLNKSSNFGYTRFCISQIPIWSTCVFSKSLISSNFKKFCFSLIKNFFTR